MLETASCATMRLAESPEVDCVALQSLKTLLYDSVLQDRHPFSGGADANPNESTPTCAIGIVSSSTGDTCARTSPGCWRPLNGLCKLIGMEYYPIRMPAPNFATEPAKITTAK